MRIPRPPAGLMPAQIAAYTTALLTLTSITVTAGLIIKPLGIILLVLFVTALLFSSTYLALALYNDHADRRAARQRIKPGELVLFDHDGVQLIVDPSRHASPALAVTASGIHPLAQVDQAQQTRNIQVAAVQLAQAAPQAGGRVAEMIAERSAPAQITLWN